MAKSRWAVALALVAFFVLPTAGKSHATTGIEGAWQGTLEGGAMRLRVVFHIMRAEDGSLSATLDSPDQGATGIPTSGCWFANDTLRIEVASVRGGFEGVANENLSEIVGEWSQAGARIPLTLTRTTDVPAPLGRPQEPKKPYPYTEEDVSYTNEAAGVTLDGTLTRPSDGGPHPAVFLVSGSGPQDRDATLFGHKPFLVLADHLTREGMTVLRVDERGVGKSTGDPMTATTEDLAGDARAAVNFLKSRSDVDKKKIGIIGHSEGALIAAMAARRSSDVAFVVLMAGPGVTGEELLYEQTRLLMESQGVPEAFAERQLGTAKRIYGILKDVEDQDEARAQIGSILREATAHSGQDTTSEASRAAIEAQLDQLTLPWFRYFLTYDPQDALGDLRCPVLAIYGDKDLQVPPEQSLPAVENALRAGGNSRYKTRVLPGLNHLFQTCTTGSPMEYAQIEETLSPEVLRVISDWIAGIDR